MLRDVVKLGLVTAVGLGVVATVGVGVGVVTLVAGAIFAGVSSTEPPRDDTAGTSKPKTEEKKLPKQGKPTPPPEKRPSETTKKQISQPTTDLAPESKSGRLPQSKTSAPNGRDERKAPTPIPTNVERGPESKYSSPPNSRDERKSPTPTPNRQRSSSVVVHKPGDATTSSLKEDTPRVGSSNGTALPGDKPSPLSRELEALIAPEIKHWRSERPANQETRKRGISEKPSSTALVAKAETVPKPEPAASVSVPGPLPLLPPSPVPKPKSTPHPSEAILESPSEPEMPAAVPIKDEKPTSPPNGTSSQDEPPLSTTPAPLISSKSDITPPLQAVLAQDSRAETLLSLPGPKDHRHSDVLPSTVPLVSAPIEEPTDLAADALLASTLLSMKLEAEPLHTTITNSVAVNGSGLLQGPASASRDSLASVQRRNSKLTSAAKKVSHSVKKVFKGPNGKVIHSDPQRLTSSSSDSLDNEQALPNGRAFSKLASSSRESLASTKSRRSLMDGTKKGLKRMFRGSSDNHDIEVPPVPPLPGLASTTPEAPMSNEEPAVVPPVSTPTPKPAKRFSPKSAAGQQQQAHASLANPPQSTRNAPGTPEAGNNASPLLKGMFKGRTNTRVRR